MQWKVASNHLTTYHSETNQCGFHVKSTLKTKFVELVCILKLLIMIYLAYLNSNGSRILQGGGGHAVTTKHHVGFLMVSSILASPPMKIISPPKALNPPYDKS